MGSSNKTQTQLFQEITKLNKKIAEFEKSESKLLSTVNKLKKSENNLRVIYNNTHDAIIKHDLKGKIIEVNNKMLEIYKVNKDQALTLSITDISAPDMSMEVARNHWKKALSGKENVFEWHAKRPNENSLFYVEVIHKKIKINNEDYILGNIRDITETKKVRKEVLKYREHLEELVQKRTKELEKQSNKLELQNKELESLNSVFVNREFRIKELKDEIQELKQKYDILDN